MRLAEVFANRIFFVKNLFALCGSTVVEDKGFAIVFQDFSVA
jgi:hypothetical protein